MDLHALFEEYCASNKTTANHRYSGDQVYCEPLPSVASNFFEAPGLIWRSPELLGHVAKFRVVKDICLSVVANDLVNGVLNTLDFFFRVGLIVTIFDFILHLLFNVTL